MSDEACREKSRREFLKILGGCAAAVTFPGLYGTVAQGQATASRPNVLMIVADDLNDWVGCLGGHLQARTPNIDRLAQRGVLFDNAHAAAPICNASRASFLTGLRPSTSGIYDNDQPLRSYLPNVVTMPQHFMANGYRTMGAGKFFHHVDPGSWQEYFPSKALFKHRPTEPFPPHVPLCKLSGIDEESDFGPLQVADEEMGDGKIARWAAEVLGRKYERPFFLGIGMVRPHKPMYAPGKYFDEYPAKSVSLPVINLHDLDDLPPGGVNFARAFGPDGFRILQDGLPEAVAAYLAATTFVDAQIGIILDALDESPYGGNTIVIFWTDNGFHFGEKLHWAKKTLWDRSTHCPLIMVVPGLTTPGGRCTRTVSMMDVYPSLADICGLSPRSDLEGVNLKPLLQDPNATWDRPAVTTFMTNNHTVRSERWRYIRYSDGGEELYDHENDPHEHNNLAQVPGYEQIKTDLALWLPQVNMP